ncbi:MAG: ATP-grasp domain-containing protein [Gemmataceae bacterium]|nr:ATP-grasp domain-containing protein [Gemmataceae bacterium]
MRIFIYELISAGGLGGDVAASLRTEGAAMLGAIVDDFERVPGVETLTLLAGDFPESIGRNCCRVAAADESRAFRYLALQADAAVIVAPEFDSLLDRRTGWAVAAGCKLLGSPRDTIRLTTDKFGLALWLARRQVPTPETQLATHPPSSAWFPCVLKPRDGAGSLATVVVNGVGEWADALRQAHAERSGEWVVQPLHRGQAASVGFLVGPRQTVATPGATQTLSRDGRFRYLGGTAPLPEPWRRRAVALATRAVESVPGLRGFVGVDLVLGDAVDGGDDVVIEINPRLTTSYIGLRRLTDANLADLWLRLWNGESVAEPAWRETPVDFSADGRAWLAGSRS